MSKALIRRRQLLFRLGGAAFLAVPVFRDTLREARAASPLRFIVLTYPGGVRCAEPLTGENAVAGAFDMKPIGFDFGGLLSGLAPVQSDLLFVDGIGNFAMAEFNAHTPHSVLTGDSRGQAEGMEMETPDLNSIDQIVAKAIGTQTRFASLQFGVVAGSEHWSFLNGSRLDAVSDPKVMFTRLFANGVPTASTGSGATQAEVQAAAAMERLRTLRQSSLDEFADEIQGIKAISGSLEQQKLDLHLSSIRELEKGLLSGSAGGIGVSMPGAGCAVPSITAGSDVPAVGAAMNDMLFQAINCDLTRVASLQWLGTGIDGTPCTAILPSSWVPGVTSEKNHHSMQHEPDAEFDLVQTWIFSQIGALLQKLKNAPEGGGSMLDNSVVLVVSSMSHGGYHMGSPFIGFVAGKGGGQIRTGRTIDAGRVALNDLHVSLANVMGVNITTMGEAKFNKSPLNLG